MEHCRAAERALVTALALGQADPAELSGRLRVSDFADPAAGLLFDVVLSASVTGQPMQDLPRLLAQRGALRSDGYPIRALLEWLPSLPVPAHPEAWAPLVVAGSLGRLVEQAGVRVMQASDTADRPGGVGRVLAVAAAQRAAVHAAGRRWQQLPERWRDTVPPRRSTRPVSQPSASLSPAPVSPSTPPAPEPVERELLAGLVAAPHLLDRCPWLQPTDFADLGCGQVFTALRRLHDAGRPVDLVTLTAILEPAAVPQRSARPTDDGSSPDVVCRELQPQAAFPAWVPLQARQVLSAAVLRQAHQTGQDLVALAGAPAGAGGLGAPVLDEALLHFDALQQHAARWQQAHDAEPRLHADQAGRSRPGSQQQRLSPLPAAPAGPEPAWSRAGTGRTAG